ncbi:WD40 repeat-like protein [Paxillus ammoniavirescens]|nr:WD40 repeat-like protein [Paxillus ammoniavirescens]
MHTSSRSVSLELARDPSVASSSSSQSVSSENARRRVPVQVFEGHEHWVNCACFYPHEDKLVSGSNDNTLRIWDQKTGAVEVLRGHSDAVWDVDVSRDGKMVVSGSLDETVRIWDGESGEVMHVLEGHEGHVFSVGFSPDSSRVASGSSDATVRVWLLDSETGGSLAFEPIECYGTVCCVCYSPSGDRIASGAESVQIWDAETGTGILSIRDSDVASLAWTADGAHITGGRMGEVTMWNSRNGQQLRTWKAHDPHRWIAVAASPTGIHVVTWQDEKKTAFVFDVSTGTQVAALEHNQDVSGIAYTPSGRFIATVSDDKKVYLWAAPTIEGPQLQAQSSSSFLDQPAIPRPGPSRSNAGGIDGFWSNPDIHLPVTHPDQHAPSLPQRVFNSVKDSFANFFARGPPVRGTGDLVEVAAGQDRPLWYFIEPIVWTPMKKLIYIVFFCRQPEKEDEDEGPTEPPATGTDPPSALTGNTVVHTLPQSFEMVAPDPS